MTRWTRALGALDLCGPDGRPSFAKLVTAAVLAAAIATGEFGPAVALIVVAGAFGRATVMALINRSSRETERGGDAGGGR